MGTPQDFGTVQPLDHPECAPYCRDLCFAQRDPLGRLVRMTHEAWFDVLAKENRASMAARLDAVRETIEEPWQIHEDQDDPRYLLYYSEPSGDHDRLLLVAVKCLPRRFGGRWVQRVHALAGRVLRQGWGEAWVGSAYPVKYFKTRGLRVWP